MNEVWKDVVGYEDLYEISKDKIVRNKNTLYELTKFKRGGKGSYYVGLTKNGKTYKERIDTIYYKTFGENEIIEIKYEVELWVDIIGYRNIYQISNYGRVKSLDRYIEQLNSDGHPYSRFVKGRILSLNRTNGNGYHIVQLSNGYLNQPKNNEYIHILVAKHFIPNPESKPTVNHIDGNKSNNHIDNLEWATYQEQMIHAYENNLGNIVEKKYNSCKRGSENPSSKLNEKEAMEIYDLAFNSKYTQKEIGMLYAINRRTVEKIKYKKTWKHIHKAI